MNNSPEKNLVTAFKSAIYACNDIDLKPIQEFNFNCRSKKYADIEFISTSDSHWIIEAKSHKSKDAHNSVHKIFGELLKETGRARNHGLYKFGVLIPIDGRNFYSRLFSVIPKEKFIAFGNIIPVSAIFCLGEGEFVAYDWSSFYDYHENNQVEHRLLF